MNTICLCMIVKDEAPVIQRCLDSVKPYVDTWLIVDTGSTDNTIDLIKESMSGIPGRVVEMRWFDFGHNRTAALDLARPMADYALVIDADEELSMDGVDPFAWSALEGDVIMLNTRLGNFTYRRPALLSLARPWRYVGAIHEYPDCGEESVVRVMEHPEIIVHQDGARGRGMTIEQKYRRDAILLEEAIALDPENTRYQYYLARSYLHAGMTDYALSAFRRRVHMDGGFDEEVYDSLLEIARIFERQNQPFQKVQMAYLASWENRPTRAEPLYELARYCRQRDRFALARMFALQALFIGRPNDLLWVNEEVYTWRCCDEYAVACYWTGDYRDSVEYSLQALETAPEEHRDRIQRNLEFARNQLGR